MTEPLLHNRESSDEADVKGVPAGIDDHTSSMSEKSGNADDLSAVKAVVSRYVNQLLHGCGHPACKEALCATGRRNTSRKPVRDYTPRSARGIAITLASGPKPRSHLCSFCHAGEGAVDRDRSEGPRDPSAFMQHLSDTSGVRRLCTPSTGGNSSVLSRESRSDLDSSINFEQLHSVLNSVVFALTLHGDDNFNAILDWGVDNIHHCIQWLRSTSPYGSDSSEWSAVNVAVSWGYESPLKFSRVPPSETLQIFDHLRCEPLYRLLCHMLKVIADTAQYHTSNNFALGQGLAAKLIPIVGKDNAICLDLIVWLKTAFLRNWDGEMVLADGTIASAAIRLLNCIFRRYVQVGAGLQQCEEVCAIGIVPARLDATELAQSYLNMGGHRTGHLLNYSWLFTFSEKTTYFRTMNHLRMRKAHSDAEKAVALRSRVYQQTMEMEPEGRLKYLEEHYLLINVSRANVLQDAFDQLWQRRKSELLRPLRVRLGETDELEVGHDLGGVQIEFFNLVCKELLSEAAQMFTTDPTTGLSYFRPGSLQPLYMFELCGLLFGLAVYNGITLPVDFPKAFYRALYSAKLDLVDIEDGWPDIARSLNNILKDDVPGLEWVLPVEANGLRLTVLPHDFKAIDPDDRNTFTVVEATRIDHHEQSNGDVDKARNERSINVADNTTSVDIESIADAWPGWHFVKDGRQPTELTPEDRTKYVEDYVYWLIFGFVAPQWHAFKRGFFSVIDRELLYMLPPGHLRAIVEGSRHLDIDELRRATQYTDYDPSSRYIQKFWRLVTAWPNEKQKQLLKFVTATDRMPVGGASNFTFRIERPKPENLDLLPTSSTCFRTLLLPKYPSVEVLDKKLSLAFEYGLEGFGTG